MSKLPNPKEFKDYKATLSATRYSTKKTESISSKQMAQEFNSFEPLSPKCMEHLLELFPEWMFDNSHPTDLEYFSYLMRFDAKVNSLVVAVTKNTSLQEYIVSYKHRYKGGVKWRTRAGTHPNNIVLNRIYTDNEPIIVVEGIRDFLAGILLGFNVIGIPTASYKGSITKYISRDDEVIFLIEDKPAYEVMMRLAKEVSPITENIRYKMPTKEKLDLSDMCFRCQTAEEVMDEISRTASN